MHQQQWQHRDVLEAYRGGLTFAVQPDTPKCLASKVHASEHSWQDNPGHKNNLDEEAIRIWTHILVEIVDAGLKLFSI